MGPSKLFQANFGHFKPVSNLTIEPKLGTQITPQGWIFWTVIFYNLKKSYQDLSNGGSTHRLLYKWTELLSIFLADLPT